MTMETIKLSDNKEFKKVKYYMSDYFQNSKHYLFSDSVDVLTKSNGEKYNFMYCFHCEENEDIPILGVALLWHESKTTNLIDEVDGIMFFDCGMEYFMKAVDEDYDYRAALSLSFREMSLNALMPFIQALLLNKVKVNDGSCQLFNELQSEVKMWR